MLSECREIELRVDHNSRHSSAAVRARHGNTVHGGVRNTRTGSDDGCDFTGRDVLPFPTERVPDPVDEVEETLRILAHQIPSAIPGISLGKYVAQNLFFRGPRVCVPFETTTLLTAGARYLTDCFAGLVNSTAHAAT